MAGSSPFNVIHFFVTEFAEFSEKHLGKTPINMSSLVSQQMSHQSKIIYALIKP